MNQALEKQQEQGARGGPRAIIAGILFLIFTAQISVAASPADPADWMGSGGAVLLQHTGSLSALGLQAFKSNSTAAQWTRIPENAGDWTAVAMDGSRVLFFYKPDSLLAVCTLGENGAPVDWLPLKGSFGSFSPVALEGNHILIQRDSSSELRNIEFDKAGGLVSQKRIWSESKGWAVRGMDSNRILLEHTQTGQVAVWAGNPKGPLFRPYLSFTLERGWSVRDFSGDYVLIQQGETGAVVLVELGDGYKADRYTKLVSVNEGWRAVALAL